MWKRSQIPLRMPCIGLRVLDVIQGQIKLIGMYFRPATVFRAPVRKHADDAHAVLFEEREHTIV